MNRDILVIVLTHVKSDGTLALNKELVESIRSQKSAGIEFMLSIHDKHDLFNENNALYKELRTVFDIVNIFKVPTYYDVRNSNLEYAVNYREYYSHLALIDGDDDICPYYTEELSKLKSKCDDFIVFGGYWYQSESDKFFIYPEYCVKYTNWLYLWNIDWLKKVIDEYNFTYFKREKWPDDEIRFIKLTQFYHKPFKFHYKPLYKYYKYLSDMSNNNEGIGFKVAKFFTHTPDIELCNI